MAMAAAVAQISSGSSTCTGPSRGWVGGVGVLAVWVCRGRRWGYNDPPYDLVRVLVLIRVWFGYIGYLHVNVLCRKQLCHTL